MTRVVGTTRDWAALAVCRFKSREDPANFEINTKPDHWHLMNDPLCGTF